MEMKCLRRQFRAKGQGKQGLDTLGTLRCPSKTILHNWSERGGRRLVSETHCVRGFSALAAH